MRVSQGMLQAGDAFICLTGACYSTFSVLKIVQFGERMIIVRRETSISRLTWKGNGNKSNTFVV